MSDYTTQLYCSILVLLPPVAGRPIGVTATRNGYNSVLVSWTAPSPPPAGYEMFHQTTSDATRLSVRNTTSTMMTVTGLTLGVTYYIFVVSFGAEEAPVLPSTCSMVAIVLLCELLVANYCFVWSHSVLHAYNFLKIINEIIATQLPQLYGTPTLTPHTTSIMVSQTHPQFLRDSYTISYSCQLLCDSQIPSVQANTETGTVNNRTIPSLNAGSILQLVQQLCLVVEIETQSPPLPTPQQQVHTAHQ